MDALLGFGFILAALYVGRARIPARIRHSVRFRPVRDRAGAAPGVRGGPGARGSKGGIQAVPADCSYTLFTNPVPRAR